MADTATRLIGPVQLGTSPATVYTVPALTTAILRHLRVANTGGATATFTLSIGADAAGTRLYSATPIPGGSVLDWAGFEVLAAGEHLEAYSDTATTLTLTSSGVTIT